MIAKQLPLVEKLETAQSVKSSLYLLLRMLTSALKWFVLDRMLGCDQLVSFGDGLYIKCTNDIMKYRISFQTFSA